MNRSVGGQRRHLLWSNFWALPCTMIVAAVLATFGLLVADDNGAASWVARFGWPFALSANVAQALAGGLVTVHTAFATLYFSITLLVLTIAASNLGVRLIDRWISNVTIRVTLGLLLSLLAASLILLLSVHPDRADAPVPRLSLLVLTGATIVTLGWMASALHQLGRMVHVDTSIAQLGRDAAAGAVAHGVAGPSAPAPTERVPVLAPRTGYIEEIDCDGIAAEARRLGAHAGLARVVGDFIMAGEAIGWASGTADGRWMEQRISCASFRNDTSGPVFEANLLVEVAARALSPAVNDPYTALACCDRLGSMFAAALAEHQGACWWPDADGAPRLELPGERVTLFMDNPLKLLRQAAAGYPPVAIHLIRLLGRLPHAVPGDRDVCGFLFRHAAAIAEHAAAGAVIDDDRADIAAALADARQRLCPSGEQPAPTISPHR